ncbi:MAG: threonine/serine dehydratase [Sulfolobales archaeon]|nr:threonine/serine dehydratase [Sulfolobales archaeon]MCX8186120.1 threonine/serine dehydratase [Sulfolobales archaeon]MDW7969415.1 threonine/serine dehydratase [Sulfolobales archaeon]
MINVKLLEDILNAEETIRKYIRVTPLEHSIFLSKLGEAQVHLKLENQQVTGSFKIRGVINKLLSHRNGKSFVTASTGNHGVAFAYALRLLGLEGTVFLPENVSPAKVDDIMLYDVDVRLYGKDSLETELYARKFAEEHRAIYVSPYNDLKVIAGQGTIAVELLKQLEDFNVIIVPVGGGGLASGIASYLKNVAPHVEIVGVQPENSAVMYHSIKAGRVINVESKPTLADGVAGGVEEGAITYELCRRYVDNFVLIAEEEIRRCMKLMLEKHHMVVEGSAALPVAAYLKNLHLFKDKKVVLVITGCRVDLPTLKKVIES